MKWDKLVYTGSSDKAKLVAQAAAENLVPILLECGGKSPVVVDETADAVYAAKKTLCGKMPNLGQTCLSADYVLCHESKVDEYINTLRDYLKEGFNNG